MQYTMNSPCEDCPFRVGSGFPYGQLWQHAAGEFACHHTCELNEGEYSGVFEPTAKSVHCAGALIFLEKRNRPHQMMRIAERLGFYDRRRLDMEALVQ